jgi:ferredoxin-NADP reductase
VLVEGPFGRLSDRVRTRRKVALIGAGVGVTPLRALAEELEHRETGDVVLLHRFTEQPLFAAELTVLAREQASRWWHCPDLAAPRTRGSATTSARSTT